MKFIHTADWHLGHRLYQRERDDEFRFALDALLGMIRDEGVELLIVAGDIFDTDAPPNTARRLYFDFLCELANTPCRDVVIVAGNHDSPATLEATKELLRRFNIHIVGQPSDDRRQQIIEIKDALGELRAVVAAVPYLRERDLRSSQSGLTSEERLRQLQEGIQRHYAEIRQEVLKYQDLDIPIIATGHLYVTGAERDGRSNTIHMGGIDLFEAKQFPTEFDYVALGHLHRPQKLKGFEHIIYSGTLIPLDFNELNYEQSVRLVEWQGKKMLRNRTKAVPQFRKIRHYKYNLADMKAKLEALEGDRSTWLKLEVLTQSYDPSLVDGELLPLLLGKQAEILSCGQLLVLDENGEANGEAPLPDLAELSELDVFRMCLDRSGVFDPEKKEELENSFLELLSGMQDRD